MDRLLNSANWGRKSNNDHDSSLREPRRKQIESLLTELPQLRVVPNDDSRFQLALQLNSTPESPLSTSAPHLARTTSTPSANNSNNNSNNMTMSHDSHSSSGTSGISGPAVSTATLTIYLPPGFPEEEPRITIHPNVRHLWVDGTVTPSAVTGHERLMPGGWSTHANLGKIVKEIVASIQRTGVLVGGESDDVNSNSNNNSNNSISGSNNANAAYNDYSHKPPPPIPGVRSKSLGQVSRHSGPATNMNGSHYHHPVPTGASPSLPSNFVKPPVAEDAHSNNHGQNRSGVMGTYTSTLTPEARIVMELSQEQLEELVESPIALEHFVDHLEVVINSRTLKREWWLGNDNVARRNLALEAEMAQLQQSTAEGHKVAMELQMTLEEKLQQQQDALWRFKPETLQSKLRSAAAESDELSESIAQSFLEGKLDQEGFIRQYRDLRKVYHLREMKNERIGSILRNHPSATAATSALTNGSGILGQEQSGSILKTGNGTGPSVGTSGPGGAGTSDAWVML
ncbi:Vacuolar protein sorting-associated protein 37A [Mortierella polycephala]|uniref:Vacuolar protein sorting-associated protein 37A n=1 Tax=Mortierella polycephala TaxID=41804 RepID=A0A9P6PS88_9FUNG|nr:Vacuolar protein sorting-associated protein 37A [Mortierella polycephala]